ncbi:MAG TPA: TonB family protein [Gemmatimonadaceae bacterium]
MLGTLIETRSRRQRRLGGTLVSIALHTAVVGLVVVVTARAAPRPRVAPPPATPVVYVSPAPPPAHPAPAAPQLPRPDATLPSIPDPVIAPVTVPTTLPALDPSKIVVDQHWYDTRPAPSPGPSSAGAPGLSSGPVNGAWDAASVDRAVVPRTGNPLPHYPETMRTAHIEGHVDVQFIVDTAGRAEPRSIRVIDATHSLFADAVRDVLLRSRYQPAEAHGMRVRQVVEQRFEFALRQP